MLVKTKVNMDLQRPSHPAIVNAVQGDQNSRCLELALFAGGMAWPVPDGVTVAMRYCKPDKTRGYYDTMPDGTAAYSIAGNTISVLLAPQILTVAGTVVAQVEMILGSSLLATFTMQVNVSENPAAGVLVSEDYVNWLHWIEGELDAYLEKVRVNSEILGGTVVGSINMNGHPLTGLNAPTENTAAANKGYVDGAVKTARPVNLLDNSDFTNPVNQRGQTSYSGSGYTIDRWRPWDEGTISITEDGISATITLFQYVEPKKVDAEKKYTMSAGFADGTVVCGSGSLTNGCGIWTEDTEAWAVIVEDEVFVRVRHANKKVWWAALYEGEYTIDTLPEYQPKDDVVELMACLRYFRLYATEAARPSHGLDCSPPMRIDAVTPGTLEIDGVTYYYNSADL